MLVFFFAHVGAKDEKLFFSFFLFFFLFFFVLFVIELNATLKMSPVYLDHFLILKQPEPGLNGKVC